MHWTPTRKALLACGIIGILGAIGTVIYLSVRNPGSLLGGGGNSGSNPVDSHLVVVYYTDFNATPYPLDNIGWKYITDVQYAFGSIDPPAYEPAVPNPAVLQALVKRAHSNGVRVMVSLGGWTGSRYISTMASSNATRARFVAGCATMVKQYELDGIDLDWEYPGRVGMSCNAVDPANDTTNLKLLLSELRAALQPVNDKAVISMAVYTQPFQSDVKDFVPLLDRIHLMTYDINGPWSGQAGPNAPLSVGDDAVRAWSAAGFPKTKMTMGVPFYGRSVTSSGMGQAAASNVPKGDVDDERTAEPCPGSPSVYSGFWKWSNLRSEGVVGDKDEAISGGWKRTWDDTSQTPWMVHTEKNLFISYDDRTSLGKKVDSIKQNGLAGVMAWSINMDNNNELTSILAKIK